MSEGIVFSKLSEKPPATTITVEYCSSDAPEDASNASQQLSQMQSLAASYLSRGWSSADVSRYIQPSAFVCGGATGPVVRLIATCSGSIDGSDVGASISILRYRATGSIGWLVDNGSAVRCNPNPAP